MQFQDDFAALSLAMIGNSVKAQFLAGDLAKRFPDDTLVQSSYLPTLRAKIALNRKGAAQAIDSLQVAVPIASKRTKSVEGTYLNNAVLIHVPIVRS